MRKDNNILTQEAVCKLSDFAYCNLRHAPLAQILHNVSSQNPIILTLYYSSQRLLSTSAVDIWLLLNGFLWCKIFPLQINIAFERLQYLVQQKVKEESFFSSMVSQLMCLLVNIEHSLQPPCCISLSRC